MGQNAEASILKQGVRLYARRLCNYLEDMGYYRHLGQKWAALTEWLDLKKEQGGAADEAAKEVERALEVLIRQVESLPGDEALAAREPDDLESIRKLRPEGPRTLDMDLSAGQLEDRILGAWLGRAAGCMLGVPVEGFSRHDIEAAAAALDQPYPLRDYWKRMPKTTSFLDSYNGLPYRRFLKSEIQYVMPDDDLLYTLLDLLILEEKGLQFTAEDAAEMWLKYVPFACTAEHVALENLREGLKPPQTALKNNPYVEYLGADIRADGWGYGAAGRPELAAEWAWREATISHTRNGLYGAMYYAAVIAAALVTGNIRESLRLGLTEIPAECRLAEALRETLDWCADLNDYARVLDKIRERFAGMHIGHTINNACVVVAGLELGRDDFELIITQVVMAGMDTDCNGASAGSIAGAAWGEKALPRRWVEPLGDVHRSYLNCCYTWSNRDIARRFARIALEARKLDI